MVVDNETTASQIIEITKGLGGKIANVNIYPLNWVDDDIEEEKENHIGGYGFQRLFDKKYIKAKGADAKDMERLAKNIFEKYGVIKEYEDAVEVAAKFRVNCITENR